MANEGLAPNVHFITDAAHLLARTAPETSAHLMTQRDVLMFHHGLMRTDAQRQHVCGCCGQIMTPGQGSSLRLESDRTMRERNRRNLNKGTNSQARTPGTRKEIHCGMCGRYTKLDIPPAPPIPKRGSKATGMGLTKSTFSQSKLPTAPTVATATADEPLKVSANASSKKRAKNRKQGLQALLQQSQASTSHAGLGLSLSDFLKK